MTQLLKKLLPGEQAESLSEYALLLLLASMMAVSAMRGFASAITGYYSGASTRVEAARRRGSPAGASLDNRAKGYTDTASFSRGPKGSNDK